MFIGLLRAEVVMVVAMAEAVAVAVEMVVDVVAAVVRSAFIVTMDSGPSDSR